MSLKVSHLYKSYDKPIIQDFSYTDYSQATAPPIA